MILTLMLASACVASPAAAQGLDQLDGWFDKLHRRIVVEPDGRFTETIDDVFVIAPRDDAMPDIVQRVLHWNGSAGSMQVLEAATLKADGTRIEAPPDMRFEDLQGAENGLFQGQRFLVVSFIDFEPGDRILLRARHRRELPFFPGHFFELRVAPPQAVRDMQLIYELPASMTLHHDARGFETHQTPGDGQMQRHVWHYTGQRPPAGEHGAVSASDYADRLVVSTMPDHATLARAYLAEAAAMAEPTQQIRELAWQIAGQAPDNHARAKALFDWVRTRIAYGGEYLGRASVVPRPAQRTLEDRQGDCKDHATLFEALLKAVGIDSSPVLLNASNAYQMPSVPTLGIFNHVMTWIPELRLFVDSSAISVDFGELPTVLSDKPALIVKQARIARTPPQRPREQSIALQVGFSVSGNALVTMDDVALGWTGSTRREVFRVPVLIELGSAAQSMLLASTLRGDAWLEVREDPQAARRSALRLEGEVQGLLQGPRLRLLSAIGSGIASLAQDYAPHRRRSAPWVCVSARIREQADYQLAESMRIAQLPSRVSIDGKGFRYRASYHLHGSKLQVRRSLSIDVESNVCAPERFETLQGLFDDVRRDLGASALLRSAWRAPAGR
ncbi:MAG: DUF3857 domain-containing transglutaminase family protein [Quisquiliibacterium sp.]